VSWRLSIASNVADLLLISSSTGSLILQKKNMITILEIDWNSINQSRENWKKNERKKEKTQVQEV
jgi:hypothetical protein